MPPRVSSTRPERRSGGSIGRSASASIRSKSVIVDSHLFLQLLDRTMDQDLRRPVRAPQRARDLAVVHTQREAHDQRLAAIVGEMLEVLHDLAQLLAALGDRLGPMAR